MSKVICEREDLVEIADAIKRKINDFSDLRLQDMPSKINNIEGISRGRLTLGNDFTDKNISVTYTNIDSIIETATVNPYESIQVDLIPYSIIIIEFIHDGSSIEVTVDGAIDYNYESTIVSGMMPGLGKFVVALKTDIFTTVYISPHEGVGEPV